jgi:hypothetical protein
MWLQIPDAPASPMWEGPLVPAEDGTTAPTQDPTRGGSSSVIDTAHGLPHVSIGTPDVWRLEDLYLPSAISRAMRAKLDEADFHFVRLCCSFRPLRDEVRIEWARFTVRLLPDGAGRQPIVFDLHPIEVTQEVRRNVKVTLSPTIKFHEVEASVGGVEFGFEYPELQPVVSGTGAGESEPSWDYEAQRGLRLQGSKWMHLLLQAPRGMRPAMARLELTADVVHRGIRLPALFRREQPEPLPGLTVQLWG